LNQLKANQLQDSLDLSNPDVFRDGRSLAIFERLRREEPVHWNGGSESIVGWWDITRYDDICAISKDTETFSSVPGVMMPMPRDPEMAMKSAGGGGKTIIRSDPPRHTQLRRLLLLGFTPKSLLALEPRIRRIAQDLISGFVADGGGDFVNQVSSQLPLAVICELMGLGREHWPLMFDLTNKILGFSDPVYQTDIPPELRGTPEGARKTADIGTMQMFAFLQGVLEERRKSPGEDLVSVIARGKIDEETLSDEDILWFCFLLVIAGNETTRNSISGSQLALIERPEALAWLAANPAELPLAVEELLRWVSPVAHMARTARKETEIRGVRIREGERVTLWYPSANRDAEAFSAPDTLILTRRPPKHLAFGHGIHTCLGAHLARLEMKVFFEEWFRSGAQAELIGPCQRLRSIFLNGITKMPLSVRRD
jgi:cytochrome P450